MAVRNLKIALNYPNGGTISSEVVEKLRVKVWNNNGECISNELVSKFKIGTDLVFGEEEPHIQWVDLGLPSGTLWADRNLGANSPNEYGTNYAWGETETKETFTTANYFLGGIISATELQSLGVIDTEYLLTDTYDVCKVKLGGECSMPTQTQAQELVTNTTLSIEEVEGQNIAILTSKINGRAIRMPLSGLNGGKSYLNERLYYWTKYKTSPLTDNDSGHVLRVILGNANATVTSYRMYSGLNVRAVNNDYCVKWVDMGNSSILFGDRFLGTDPTHPYGRFYAWGEITDKEEYTTDNYQFQGKTLTELKDEAVVNSSRTLNSAYDVASQVLKTNVAMPQIAHIQWLYNNTTNKVSEDGMYVILTSTINGNVIQLPLAGTYQDDTLVNVGRYGRIWTKTLYNQEELKAYIMTLNNSTTMFGYTSTTTISQGFSILPIKSK